MRFAFTEQQIEFRDAVRQVLDNECAPADLRAAYDAPAARTPRWSTLAEMGVVGLTVAEEHGGLGLALLDLVPLLEEAGRAGLPEPLLETTALAVPVLAAAANAGAADGGAADGRARAGGWLAGIAAGDVAAAIGIARTGIARTGIAGTGMAAVPGADGADLLILEHQGPNGTEIHAVPVSTRAESTPAESTPAESTPADDSGEGSGDDTATVTPVASLDPTRRLGTVTWTPSPATLLASGAPAERVLVDLADRAAIATAAELVGLADRMIAIAAEYAKERKQFGKPIGSFQAVKHLLAGAQVKLEFARPVVYGAAWSLDQGEPDTSRRASMAKAYASDAATEAARVSLQVHGAIGYTWECDLHLFLKRAWALAEAWGSAAEHRSRVLASLVAELP